MDQADRQKRLARLLTHESLGAFLVRKKENIAYLTGTKGEDAVLFISPRKNILITDSRYEEEYKRDANGYCVRIAKNRTLGEIIAEACAETCPGPVGFEADRFTYHGYSSLKKQLGKKKLVPYINFIENLRMVKDETEIRLIKQACKHGAQLMNYAIRTAKPGISESGLKRAIEIYALENKIRPADFEIIAASGINASMPHAAASEKLIKRQEMLIIDLGAMYLGYNSDLTRTVFLGKIDRKYLHIYNIILAAQRMAIDRLKPGVYAKDIDAVSRQYISDRGMGSFFLHSLGHGIGRETHEIPAISHNSKIRLKKDMIITIEPGIYIPGWGGIRIEDTVLITGSGCEVLTKGAIKYAGRDQ